MQDTQNNWRVKAQGKIYEADYEELKQWIAEGAVLLSDQVKRGNLRRLSIERVPELAAIVNSNDLIAANGVSSAEEVIETNCKIQILRKPSFTRQSNFIVSSKRNWL